MSSLPSWTGEEVPPTDYSLRFVKGVGPRVAELLSAKGLNVAEDLLRYFPYKYLDQRALHRIRDLQPGADRVVAGKVLACGMALLGRRRRIFEVALGDATGTVSLKWFRFNPKQMMGGFRKGQGLIVSGAVTKFRNEMQFIHPTVQTIDPDVVDEVAAPGIVPVYSQIPGVHQKSLRRMVREAFGLYQGRLPDPLPPSLREKYHLPDKETALREIHFPPESLTLDALTSFRTKAFRREIFEEFFFMELGLALRRARVRRDEGTALNVPESSLEAWKAGIPFALTGAQARVLSEIRKDLGRPEPMNRLLQGDVGSGKTIVALMAAMIAIENGHQVAMMAPTEILAEQHYRTAQKLLGTFKIPMALLTSALEPAERRRAHSRIGKGFFPLVIGTHALISEGVTFPSLGLVIIDEQHRFGVLQRAALKEKGVHPHVLVMTATPIPRTLAMTIYGDLDVSVIDELPPGRQKIHTAVIRESKRRDLYRFMSEVMERGEQGYVVYPLIEESEKLALKDATRMSEEMQRMFPGKSVALLHGRTPAEEKEAVMRAFKSGAVDLLVSTTVIEVGIDVPNATLMVIEHAERFGLSQLHQLRGRVGRGSKASTCLLVTGAAAGDLAYRRLEVLCETNDGFRIAEEDLRIRGPGDFIGTRQSGLPELRVANLIRDYRALQVAREEAFLWLQKDPALKDYPPIKENLIKYWGDKIALAEIS